MTTFSLNTTKDNYYLWLRFIYFFQLSLFQNQKDVMKQGILGLLIYIGPEFKYEQIDFPVFISFPFSLFL